MLTVTAMGIFILLLAYAIAMGLGRTGARFAGAVLPAQAVALSTQSFARQPARDARQCRAAGAEGRRPQNSCCRWQVVDFPGDQFGDEPCCGLLHPARFWRGSRVPLAIAIAGVLIASVISLSAVSLPGSISFVVSIGPIALADGRAGGTRSRCWLAVGNAARSDAHLGQCHGMNVAVTSAVDPPPRARLKDRTKPRTT